MAAMQCERGRKNFGDTQLAKLAPLAANIRWLDLAERR